MSIAAPLVVSIDHRVSAMNSITRHSQRAARQLQLSVDQLSEDREQYVNLIHCVVTLHSSNLSTRSQQLDNVGLLSRVMGDAFLDRLGLVAGLGFVELLATASLLSSLLSHSLGDQPIR